VTEISPEDLGQYREEAEATRDEPLSTNATRPARAKVLSIRLNPEEFEELNELAERLKLPASTLVRGWILSQLRADTDTSPVATVDQIAREIEQLRRRLVS
jgi:predicted DNA-binding protein